MGTSNIGTTVGTNWGLSGKSSASQYAGAYVEEPEYLAQGWTAGQDSSYSSGGSTGATFNAHNNQNNASTTAMTNEQTNSQSSTMSGGSRAFGSSKRGPGGSSYSSGTSFNLNQGTSQTALNKKTLSTNNSSSSNIGTSMGTNWGLSGKTSASQYAGAYVEEPEYLMQGWTAGQDSSYSSGGSTGATFNAHNNQNNASTTTMANENTNSQSSTMSG